MSIEHVQIDVDQSVQIDLIISKLNEVVDAVNLLNTQGIKPMGFDDGFMHIEMNGKLLRKNMKKNTAWEEVEYPTDFVAVEDQKNSIVKEVKLSPIVDVI